MSFNKYYLINLYKKIIIKIFILINIVFFPNYINAEETLNYQENIEIPFFSFNDYFNNYKVKKSIKLKETKINENIKVINIYQLFGMNETNTLPITITLNTLDLDSDLNNIILYQKKIYSIKQMLETNNLENKTIFLYSLLLKDGSIFKFKSDMKNIKFIGLEEITFKNN
jgi:hypothetical protein